MKKSIALFLLIPLAVWGSERAKLDEMLAVAATNQGKAYITNRNEIVALGTNALPLLAQAGGDASLSWQQRLAARIAYEHITRGGEIDALRTHDWRTHPGYDVKWEQNIMGPVAHLWQITVPYFVEKGLWYYYIELTWKCTDETPITKDRRFVEDWTNRCRQALKDQPEKDYLQQAMINRLQNDETLGSPDAVEFYNVLRENKVPESVPVLSERLEACFKKKIQGPESHPGEHAEIKQYMLNRILAFADTRYTGLLEKVMADHPALASMTNKLTEVRARPAPVAKPEPPFRLGTNLVVVTP